MEMTVSSTKVCIKCGVPKNLDEFATARQNVDGKKNTCRTCEADRNAERHSRRKNEPLVIGEEGMVKMPFDWIWTNW